MALDNMSTAISHAKVRFEEDKSIQVVSINKIIEFREVKPVDVHDFDRNRLYKCLWTDEKNPEEIELAVQISGLGVIKNEEDLQRFQKQRGRFPKVNETIVQEFYAEQDSEEEDIKNLKKKKLVKDKKACLEKKKIETQILKEKMDKFMQSSGSFSKQSLEIPLSIPEEKTSNSSEHTQPQGDNKILQEQLNDLLAKYDNMQKKYTDLERENASLRCPNQNLQVKIIPSEKINVKEDENSFDMDKSESDKQGPHRNLEMSPIPLQQVSNFPQTSSPILSQGLSSKKITNDQDMSVDLEMAALYEKEKELFTPSKKKQRLNSSASGTELQTSRVKRILDNETDSQKCKEKNDRDNDKTKKKKKFHDTKTNKIDIVTDNDDKRSKDKEQKHDEKTEAGKREKVSEGPKLFKKYEFVENGRKMHKTFLGEDTYMNTDTWNEYLSAKTANRFVVALLRDFYTPQELSKRSLSGSDTWKTPNGVHTRQKLTPKKSKIIRKCTKYFLKKKYKLSRKELHKQFSFTNRYITGHIAKVVNGMKKNKSEDSKPKNNDTADDSSDEKNEVSTDEEVYEDSEE